MRDSSVRFSEAILKSIKKLEESRVTITQKTVIDNAFLENGRPVGKSTLFRKDPKTKLHFYNNLLLEIDKAISRQRRSRGRATKQETVANYKDKLKELTIENQALVDQIVSQEAELIKAKSDKGADVDLLIAKDDDIYMLAKVLMMKSAGPHESLNLIISRYEIANRGSGRLKDTLTAAEKLRQELLGATVSLPSMRE